MAKISKSISFRNAQIDSKDMTITETNKEDIKVYDIAKLLDEWHGVEGISISIKQDNELPEDGDE